jgi:hypothetical protein
MRACEVKKSVWTKIKIAVQSLHNFLNVEGARSWGSFYPFYPAAVEQEL